VTTVTTTAAPSVTVRRARRPGSDRAFVSIGDQEIGHRDLRTGDVLCSVPESRDVLIEATEALVHRSYVPRHARTRTDVATPPPRGGLARMLRTRQPAGSPPEADPVDDVIGRRLEELPAGWHVLNSVPVGDRGTELDHVVIGPAGVVTVQVKNHPRANVWVCGTIFKVDGYNQHYVRNCRFEAQRASRLLSAVAAKEVPVRGAIAVVGADGFVVKDPPRDIAVVTRKTITAYLHSLPTALDRTSVRELVEIARQPATWQPPVPAPKKARQQ
jgi:Nuclease-related domain